MKQKQTISAKVFFLAASLVLFPLLGCAEQQEQAVELDLRIDDTPIEREAQPPVNSYAEILKIARPAVVSVFSQRVVEEPGVLDHPAFRRFFGEEDVPQERMQRGVGSGVIVSPQGYVLTNDHVVEDAAQILVQFANGGGEVEAEIVGRDSATDIAVLKIRVNGDLPFAILGDSDLVQVGDVVFALGNALGIGHAVTSGIISARGRTGIGILGEEGYEDFIQTDASMNIGNSGGPLVDSRGRVIGINTAIASPGGGNVGIGFAIPINMARDVMQHLLQYGEVRRGFLGLTLQDTEARAVQEYGAPGRGEPSEGEGVLVVNVVEDSPAAEAGLQPGDLVVALNGEPIDSAGNLRLRVAQLGPEAGVELGVIRNGERMNVHAVLDRLEDGRPVPQGPRIEGDELLPGLSVAPLTPEIQQQFGFSGEITGLLVTEVAENSPYAEMFPEGGVIMQVNGEPVEDLESARAQMQPGRNLFLVFYQGSFHYIVVETTNP
jgi:Do/DeqQ family serine protease